MGRLLRLDLKASAMSASHDVYLSIRRNQGSPTTCTIAFTVALLQHV